MPVVKQMLGIRIVYVQHGKGQPPLPGQGPKPVYPGGGLLASADQLPGICPVFPQQHVHQIPSIVDDDVGAKFQRLPKVLPVFRLGGPKPAEHLHPLRRQGRAYVVLGGQGVAARGPHLRAPRPQHQG